MKKAFPASQAQQQVLRHAPTQSDCMRCKSIQTLNNLSDMIVYLWLVGDVGYWYYICYVDGNMLIGYALVNNWWYYTPIPKSQILRYF